MKLAIGVIGGVVIGGYAAAQLSGDAVMLGVIGGGVIGAIIAKRLGADTKTDGDNGAWYDGSEQSYDNNGWGGDDGGGDGGD